MAQTILESAHRRSDESGARESELRREAPSAAGQRGAAREQGGGRQPAIEDLIRRLIAQVVTEVSEARHGSGADSDEVLLAATVDGVRLLLTRERLRPPASVLSPREREIARMIAKGHSDKVIATLLEISRYTVATHLRRMYAKLGVPSRAALVASIMKQGIIE